VLPRWTRRVSIYARVQASRGATQCRTSPVRAVCRLDLTCLPVSRLMICVLRLGRRCVRSPGRWCWRDSAQRKIQCGSLSIWNSQVSICRMVVLSLETWPMRRLCVPFASSSVLSQTLHHTIPCVKRVERVKQGARPEGERVARAAPVGAVLRCPIRLAPRYRLAVSPVRLSRRLPRTADPVVDLASRIAGMRCSSAWPACRSRSVVDLGLSVMVALRSGS
jgi:hypothetical protein